MNRFRAFIAVVVLAIATALSGVGVASPAAANTVFSTADGCVSPQNSAYTMASVAWWEERTSNGKVRLRSVDVYFFKNNAAYNWATSLTVADKQGTWQGQSWTGNPPAVQTVTFAGSPYRSSPVTHYAYVNASGTPGGVTVKCGPDFVYAE